MHYMRPQKNSLSSFMPILFIGFDKIARMLIDKGADVNVVNSKNNSALILAALTGKCKACTTASNGH